MNTVYKENKNPVIIAVCDIFVPRPWASSELTLSVTDGNTTQHTSSITCHLPSWFFI